jgi:methyl-accepting chemotaxis protein
VPGALAADRALWKAIAGPVQRALDAIERIAAGDYEVRVAPEELGSLAHFSEVLNALCGRQRALSREVQAVVDRLQALPERVLGAMQEVDAGRRLEAVEGRVALANINTSIGGINAESRPPLDREASSSILEMQSSIGESPQRRVAQRSVDASTSRSTRSARASARWPRAPTRCRAWPSSPPRPWCRWTAPSRKWATTCVRPRC